DDPTVSVGLFLPRPPVLVVGLPVERPAAGDGDVAHPVGVDEGGVVVQLDAFPAGFDRGQVIGGVLAESDGGAVTDVEFDVAFEVDGAGVEFAGRDDDLAAAFGGGGVDGFGDGIGAVLLAGGVGAVVGDVERALGDGGWLDLVTDLVGQLPAVRLGGGLPGWRGRGGGWREDGHRERRAEH